MKQIITLLILSLLPGFLTAEVSKIEFGQSIQQAIDILGDPIGTLVLGNKTILIYPQGDITFREGTVAEIDLMNNAQFAAQQKRKQIEREKWWVEQERLAADRFRKGAQLKAEKLKSRTFAALPAKQRIDYWRSFQISYPEVDVTEEFASVLKERQTELAEEQTLKRIAKLEARVARAEQVAVAAQTENESLKNQITIQENVHLNRPIYYARPNNICYPQKKVIVRTNNNRAVRHIDNRVARHIDNRAARRIDNRVVRRIDNGIVRRTDKRSNHSKNRRFVCSKR